MGGEINRWPVAVLGYARWHQVGDFTSHIRSTALQPSSCALFAGVRIVLAELELVLDPLNFKLEAHDMGQKRCAPCRAVVLDGPLCGELRLVDGDQFVDDGVDLILGWQDTNSAVDMNGDIVPCRGSGRYLVPLSETRPAASKTWIDGRVLLMPAEAALADFHLRPWLST